MTDAAFRPDIPPVPGPASGAGLGRVGEEE